MSIKNANIAWLYKGVVMKKVFPFLVGGLFGLLAHFVIGLLFCPGGMFCSIYVVNFFQLGIVAFIVGALIGGILFVFKTSPFAEHLE